MNINGTVHIAGTVHTDKLHTDGTVHTYKLNTEGTVHTYKLDTAGTVHTKKSTEVHSLQVQSSATDRYYLSGVQYSTVHYSTVLQFSSTVIQRCSTAVF